MEVDERLNWLERRVSTSLKPRAEELKILLSNEDSRDNLLTFCNKEEVRLIFVYLSEIPGKLLTAELSPPRNITNKMLIFLKLPGVGKLTTGSIMNDVTYIECGGHPMKFFERISRDVYLPLLGTDQSTGISSDKLLDIMHRLVSCLQLINGRIKGQVVLPMPSMEVLADAAGDGHRRLSVIHVLETTLITWIKQIKLVLRLDIDKEIAKICGKYPFPRAEVDYWSDRLEMVESLNDQLQSPVGTEILTMLEQAQSAYTVAFHSIMKEINLAAAETQEQLKYLNTVMPWFVMFENSKTPHDFVKSFKPMIRLIFLLWEHSPYYHQNDNFLRLLKMTTNGVVQKAREMVGSNVLDDLGSHGSLRQALHVCASYRGCYLDMKEKADKLNKQKLREMADMRTEKVGIVWHSKAYKESRTPRGGDLFAPKKETKGDADCELQWADSQWPARNNPVFNNLNSFMERCNDVLELVETTQHFNLLACTAALGGAGSPGLDAVVRDIHERFLTAAETFRTSVKDVLDVSKEQNFERSFFFFRSVIRDLETRLGEVLHHSFQQCWDTTCRLRLLEVFEGTSSRNLVQEGIQDIVSRFVFEMMREVKTTMAMLQSGFQEAPKHCHLPPVVNELIWLTSLRARLEEPFAKLRRVSPNSLKGDDGWKLRDLYSDLLREIERNEQRVFRNWEKKIEPDLHLKLQKPLLVRTSGEDGAPLIKINFDPDLQQILKESHHLKRMYRQAEWPEHLEKLLASAHPVTLELMAARLRIVTSHYNELSHIMTERERPLFQKKLLHIETLIEEGTLHRCWKDVDALDYVERAVHSICNDVHKNLCIILENKRMICELVNDLGTKEIDELLLEKVTSCISIHELNDLKRKHREEVASKLHMYGIRIGELISSSFVVANVGLASPAWLQYKEYLHHIVMEGLRESVISCLTLLLNRMVASSNSNMSPLLTVRMELVGSIITFRPPLDTSVSSLSLTENLEQWLVDIVRRSADLPLESMNLTEEIETDPEVTSLIEQIKETNRKTIEKCEEYLSLFKKHGFIWTQDVKRTFSEFLKGNISSKPRDLSRSEEVRSRASIVSTKSRREAHPSSSRTSSLATAVTSGLTGISEWSLWAERRKAEEEKLPTLDDFDSEIEVYQKASEEIRSIQEVVNVGWVCLNMQPIKKTLETYSRKWIFTYTKYLSDQISTTLKDFDEFLKRIEPGVEAITGQERDVMSFMKLMRIFNEVSAEQAELDAKFITMKRSISILEKYKRPLPVSTASFYKAAPMRWNNLKMKVSQAKQRLGPRIRAEAEEVSKTLQEFDDRCSALLADFSRSEALRRHCHVNIAIGIMDTLQVKFNEIRKEAQDLVELQELLEKNVADFSMLQRFSDDLNCLHQSWDIARYIREHHQDWKRHKWQKIRPRTLKRLLDGELEKINHLPSQAHSWDFVIGLEDAVHNMLACVPLMEDLNKAAMRTRHWKQLVRVTGGAVNITNQDLANMTLGQFLDLGLQHHADEVMAVVQRAGKDLVIENTLKTYEEIWLSKVFELKKHTRLAGAQGYTAVQEAPGSEYGGESEADSGMVKVMRSRLSVTSFYGKSESRNRRTSFASSSLTQPAFESLSQGFSDLSLPKNFAPIFEELESHQISLQLMLDRGTASSFTDETIKWQKTLKNVESVLKVWKRAQEAWIELNDIFLAVETRVALHQESHAFAVASRDFAWLMKHIERSPNVLQACAIPDIHMKLEKIQLTFEQCRKAISCLVNHKRERYPRLYFLPDRDVLMIACLAYDPRLVNDLVHKVYPGVAELCVSQTVSEEKDCYEISGVKSLVKECLEFNKPVLCDLGVDHWLAGLQSSIKTSLVNSVGKLLEATMENDETVQPMSTLRNNAIFCLLLKLNEMLSMPLTFKDNTPMQAISLGLQVFFSRKRSQIFSVNGDNQIHEMRQWGAKLDEAIDVIVSGTKLLYTPPNKTSSLEGALSVLSRDALEQSGSKVKQVTIDVKGAEIRESYIHLLPPQDHNKGMTFQVQCILNQFVHERELISSCLSQIDAENAGLSDFIQSFSYQSILTYDWHPDALQCRLSSCDAALDYGFEYLGVDMKLQWMPRRDQNLYYLIRSILTYKSIMEYPIQTAHAPSLVCELASIIAHPLFHFFQMDGFDRRALLGAFKGAAYTGCWVLIQSLKDEDCPWIALLSQLNIALYEALAAKRTSVVLGDEEITLEPNARAFLSVSSSCLGQKGVQRGPWSFATPLFNLQSRLFGSYRTLASPLPDTSFLMKSQLILYGFKHYQRLSVSLTKLAYLLGSILFESNHFVQKEPCDSSSICRFVRGIIKSGSRLVKKLMDFEKEKLQKMAEKPVTVSLIDENAENDEEFAVAIHSSAETEPKAPVDAYMIEQQALALALRDTLLSFLSYEEEQILKTQLFKLVFPDAEYDYNFELEEVENSIDESVFESLQSQVEEVREDIEAENESDKSSSEDQSAPATIEDVVTSSFNDQKLIPASTVVSKVLQLRELATLHSTIFVVGSAGSGKSCCIDTYLKAQEKIGYMVKRSHLWPGTVSLEELFGFWDKAEGQWQVGLYPAILQKLFQEGTDLRERHPTQPQLLCIHLDGEALEDQMDFFCACLSKRDVVTMPDGEVLKISPELKYIWEMEALGNLSPSLIFASSLLYLGEDTVPWQLLVDGWLARQAESKHEYLELLCERYIPSTVNYFLDFMQTQVRSDENLTKPKFIVNRTIKSLITSSLSIFEASVSHAENIGNEDLENYFNYAMLWGFGGCLTEEMAEEFGQWWRDTWQEHVRFPRNLQVWEVVVHPEGHDFVHWSSVLPAYTGSYGKGVAPEAFVPTVQNMAILHLAIVLSEANLPVMLVGPSGSGKTEIVKERLRSFTSQVTDVRTTAVWGCGSRDGKEIRRRLSASLEWKHSNLYVPRGKKRLMYLVDDLSIQEADRSVGQTGCETLRQLVTLNGTTDRTHHEWQNIRRVSFLATYTQSESSVATQLPDRMTRLWNILYVPYPSTQEQKCIMGTIVKTHFEGLVTASNLALPDDATMSKSPKDNQDRVELLENLIRLTVDQQETIRNMYLRTSERCFYIFTLETLVKLCRNICHMLPPTSSQEDIVAVWISELHWLYGKILVDQIDYERWKQGFLGIARKFFTDRQMEVVTRPLAVVTSLTGDLEPVNGSPGLRTYHYAALRNESLSKIKETMVHFINENNKDNPHIKLVLFPGILTLLNRLISIIRCPFRNGHSLLIARGSPALPNTLIRAAAYICGFTIAEMHGLEHTEVDGGNPKRFKSYLKSVFTNAGTKGDKLLVPVYDCHATAEFLSNVSELILSGSLDNFFDDEEETAIINAIRTDVIQAGLGYSKEVAWKSFLRNMQKNIRFILVVTEPRGLLQNLSMENPALVSALQILHFHRWEMDELVINAKVLLEDLKFLSVSERENIAHLQAAMHLRIAGLIKEEIGSDFLHLANNDTFQVFVERFVAALRDKQEEIKAKQKVISDTLVILSEVHDSSQKLMEQLDHEKIVLRQKEKGNQSFLQQIGQDRAISEEQLRLLERHQWRIERLKMLLPKYQEAYNKALSRSMALLKETKYIVQYLPHEGLSNLRSLQKPDSEIEDLLAAVIVIVKSPTSDLTWNKGAKRIMANLERFQEDLLSFDEVCMEESHLAIAEAYIAKPHFTPEYLEGRTNNSAIGSLVLWVRGVTRYHRMKISRVDPLQAKVEQTAKAIEDATQKMLRMQDKVKDLDTRLTSLSMKLEEASVDKSKQRLLTERQGKTLEKAADFEQNLAEVQCMWRGVLESMQQRIAAVVGNVALCTGLLTYLGPFGEKFRRRLLLKEWPNCLTDRGVAFDPLLFDQDILASLDDDDDESHSNVGATEYGGDASPVRRSSLDDPGNMKSEDELALAIVNTAISNELFRSWLAMGLVARQIEHLAIMRTALHRTLYVVDPFDQMHRYLSLLEPDRGNIMELDAITRDPTHNTVLEQAIALGKTLIVYNYHTEIEESLVPVIEAVNNRSIRDCEQGEPVLARVNGRRIFMPASFRLIIISRCDPRQKLPFSVSGSTIVDLVPDASELSARLRSLFLSRQNANAYHKLQRCRYFYFNVIQAFEILDSRITSGLKSQTKVSLFQETDSLNRLIKEREKLLALKKKLKKILRSLQENEASQCELITCAVSLFQVLVSFSQKDKGYRFCIEQVIQVFCQIIGSSNEPQTVPSRTISLEANTLGPGRTNEGTSEPVPEEKLCTSFIDTPCVVKKSSHSHNADEDDKGSNDVDSIFTEYLNQLLGTDLDTFTCDSSQSNLTPRGGSVELVRTFMTSFQGCFHETDEEVFICLLWFCILSCQHRDATKIIQFVLQEEFKSMQVTSQSSRCHWIAEDAWNTLLTTASWFPTLNAVLESMSSSPTSWEAWHSSDAPWHLPACATEAIQYPDNTVQEPDACAPYTLHLMALVVIRVLRLDAMKPSLLYYARQSLKQVPTEAVAPDLHSGDPLDMDKITFIYKWPLNFVGHLKMASTDVAKRVTELAKLNDKACLVTRVQPDNSKTIDISLNSAVQSDSWILIEDIENGDNDWLTQFTGRLLRLFRQQDVNWRVFLTYQPNSNKLPPFLLSKCRKISLGSFIKRRENQLTTYDFGSYHNLLLCFQLTFEVVDPSIWESLQAKSLVQRSIAFGLCVYHAILLGVQKFTPKTLSELLCFTPRDLNDALDLLISLLHEEGIDRQRLNAVAEAIYVPKSSTQSDANVLRSLFVIIMDELTTGTASFLNIGSWTVPVPPANVAPSDYNSWLMEKLQEGVGQGDWSALGVVQQLVRCTDKENALLFLANLRPQFNALTSATQSDASTSQMEFKQLQQNLNNCIHGLPAPLPAIPQDLSQLTLITHCLNQECHSFNTKVNRIRIGLEEMHSHLIRGIGAFPLHLRSAMIDLTQGSTPREWLPKQRWHSTVSLEKWLKDLNTQRLLLSHWISHQKLKMPISLAVLDSPAPMFHACRTQAAIVHGVSVDKIAIRSQLVQSSQNWIEFDPAGEMDVPLIFDGLNLVGATWDFDDHHLIRMSNTTDGIPSVNVQVLFLTSEEADQSESFFDCPVYYNLQRRSQLFSLPLRYSGKKSYFHLCNTALVLTD